MLASKRNGVLYVGVTSDLWGRVSQHQQGQLEGFTKKYGVHTLVYCEFHQTMDEAIQLESRIKHWKRAWKIHRIERMSPEWIDLVDAHDGSIKDGQADAAQRRD